MQDFRGFKLEKKSKEKEGQKRDDSSDIAEIIDLIDAKSPKRFTKVDKKLDSELGTESSKLIDIKRAFDYVGGGIHFKVALQNISSAVLTDINVTLIPAAQYEIVERLKIIDLLKPGESRGIDFNLTPLACGKSKIFGSCSFIDAFGSLHTLTIPPKEVWIKCPLVAPKKASFSEMEGLKRELQKGTAKIPFKLNEKIAFNVMIDQISALDLTEIKLQHFKGIYSGIAKITSDIMIIESEVNENNIILNVWTKDIQQATGFLAYLKNLIKMALENAGKIEGKTEKISEKILNSSAIFQRLILLFDYCEENWTMGEIIILMKEVKAKIESKFQSSYIAEKLGNWIDELTSNYQEKEVIPEKLTTNLEFQLMNWLAELNRIAIDNLEIFVRTFPEKDHEILQLHNLVKENAPLLIYLENKYTKRILQYLITIEKASGICLFEYSFTKSSLSTNLISGFLTAIRDFGSEISSQETAITKLAYKDFEIVLEEGEKATSALILKGSPPDNLIKKLKSFISEFEQKYKGELTNWDRQVIFKGKSDELAKKIFESP